MTKAENSVLVLVDVQGKLAEMMHEKETLYLNLQKLIKGIQALKVPVIWVEQIPEKMGPTISQIRELLTGESPVPKNSFSCCGEKKFMEKLEKLQRRDVILAGIETHVCIYQTASDLLDMKYNVHLVCDAVSSRTLFDRQIAIDKIKSMGAATTSVEMLLLELMRTSTHAAFRDILRIIK